MDNLTKEDINRFYARFKKHSINQCWEWNGSLNKKINGYPRFGFNGKRYLATHVSLFLNGKGCSNGLYALHSCDNPKCVNPDHLRWGTQAENMAEKKQKNRSARMVGEKCNTAKLTESQVRWIRTSGISLSKMAKKLGVSKTAVQLVRQKITWSHIP